ncbi:MAG: hypothetical protein QOD38_1791, partial [Acidimicrobiaceae bacterium]
MVSTEVDVAVVERLSDIVVLNARETGTVRQIAVELGQRGRAAEGGIGQPEGLDRQPEVAASMFGVLVGVHRDRHRKRRRRSEPSNPKSVMVPPKHIRARMWLCKALAVEGARTINTGAEDPQADIANEPSKVPASRSPSLSTRELAPSREGTVVAEYPDRFVAGLRALSQLMVDEESLDQTLQRIVTLACMSLSGCDCASVTVERSGQPRTAACTDKIALEIDEAQYAGDAGPCLQALRERTVVAVHSIPEDGRWPLFRAAAVQHNMLSSLSLPLVHRGEGPGAFNLYARPRGGFSPEDQEHGALFAEQAVVAIANAEVYWRTYDLTQNLQAALESRDLIGQAKGIIMARHGYTAEQAFDELRRASQRR